MAATAVTLFMRKSAARNKNAQNAGERQSSQHCTKKSQTAHYVLHWLSAGFLPQLIDSKLLRDSSEIDVVRGNFEFRTRPSLNRRIDEVYKSARRKLGAKRTFYCRKARTNARAIGQLETGCG